MLPTITNTEFVNHLHEMTPTNDNQPAPQTAESKKLREHLLRATGKKITAEHYAHHLCNLIGYPLVHYPQHLTETLITNPHNPQQLKTPLEHTHTWSLYEPYILNHPNALTTLLGNGTTKTFTTSTLHNALTQAKNEEQEAYQNAHENTRQAHAKHATLTEIFYTTQLPANTPALAVGTL